ncbi:hypothetical protein C8R45DRAFT_1109284 [Mycena sanguinolenta]|nr:hypothetical protein C8R45DRAFT_1109284 [Mycena sanguinolenta]
MDGFIPHAKIRSTTNTRSGAVYSAWMGPQFDFAPLLSTAVEAESDLQDDCEPHDEAGVDDVDEEWPPSDPWNAVDDEPLATERDPPQPPRKRRAPSFDDVVAAGKPLKGCHRRRALKRARDPLAVPSFSTATLPTASGAYVAKSEDRREKLGAKKCYTLTQLFALGFQLIEWDGITPRPLVDNAGRVWASLAGQPDDDSWHAAVSRAYASIKIEGCAVHFPAAMRHHRRGLFAAINVGLAYSKGLPAPTWLDNREHTPMVDRLLACKDIRRLAHFASYAFSLWAPRLHAYYVDNNKKLKKLHTNPRHPFPKSVFSCVAFNFGPRVCTFKHRDMCNLPFGWCAVQALGSFDHTKGGHLVLWDAKLVVQFPAGTLILLPSATVAHSNLPVQDGEERISFTQFTAGGLFRWVDYGGRTEADLAVDDADAYARVLAQRDKRHRAAIAASDFKTKKTYRFQAALHSADYRHRKHKEEYAAAEAAQRTTRRTRQVEANELRARHVALQHTVPAPAPAPAVPKLPAAAAAPGRGVVSTDSDDLPMDELPSFLSDDEEEFVQHDSNTRSFSEDGFSAPPRPVVRRCQDCGDEYCVGQPFFPNLQVVQRAGLPWLRLHLP